MGAVLKVDFQERKGIRQTYKLHCRDFRIVNFTLPEKAPKTIAKVLSKYNTEGELGTVFAAPHFKAADAGWNVFQVGLPLSCLSPSSLIISDRRWRSWRRSSIGRACCLAASGRWWRRTTTT